MLFKRVSLEVGDPRYNRDYGDVNRYNNNIILCNSVDCDLL